MAHTVFLLGSAVTESHFNSCQRMTSQLPVVIQVIGSRFSMEHLLIDYYFFYHCTFKFKSFVCANFTTASLFKIIFLKFTDFDKLIKHSFISLIGYYFNLIEIKFLDQILHYFTK